MPNQVRHDNDKIMEELIKTFHIELNLLVAQFVNFAIVLFVLYKFAYKPILKTLNDRTRKIEKGLKDADEARRKMEEVTIKEKEVLIEAKKECQRIIKEAEVVAVKDAQRILFEAKDQSDKMVADAKKQIDQEKEKILREAKGQIAELVVMATEKIIREKVDSNKDKELIEQAIR